MKRLKLFGEGVRQKIPIYLFAVFMILALSQPQAHSFDKAGEIEGMFAGEKEMLKAKEDALVEYFYKEGKRLLEMEDYEGAVEQFSRVLEIESDHKGAKGGMKKLRRQLKKVKLDDSPKAMAKDFMKSGKKKYRMRDYDGALDDFQDALVLDYDSKDIIEWLKRARRRKELQEAKEKKDDILEDTELTIKKKEAEERRAMLEVEEAYLPPDKPERGPVVIEEFLSPEEEAEERARKELLARLLKKMVPAVSLTEADIRDVIRQLMEITNVTIVIDEGALAEATGAAPLRLTFTTVNSLPLLEILDIALKATELAYRIEPNYIWISSPEKLKQQKLVTRTYRLKYPVRRIREVELKEYEAGEGLSSE